MISNLTLSLRVIHHTDTDNVFYYPDIHKVLVLSRAKKIKEILKKFFTFLSNLEIFAK